MTLLGLTLQQLGLAFGALGAAVTILYILKLRRRRIHVPFAKLWLRVMKEKESTSLFRRLKRLLSLLLQLAFLFLLTAALGDPRLSAEVLDGRSIVLLVDASASMKSTDGAEGTRLETAIVKAKEIVRGMSGADSLMIVRMDGQVTPLSPFENDEKALLKVVEGMQASDTRADLARALKFAGDALRERKNPLLILIGDGAYPENVLSTVRVDEKSGPLAKPKPGTGSGSGSGTAATAAGTGSGSGSAAATPASAPAVAAKKAARKGGSPDAIDQIDLRGVPVRFVPVGKASDNIGIVAFNARRYARNKLSFEIFLEVVSYRDKPAELDLQLIVDGAIVEVQRINLKAKEKARYTCDPEEQKARKKKAWCELAASGELLEARLVAAGSTADKPLALDTFPLDDQAYALLPKQRKQKVTLVSRGNLYLEGALLLDENLEVTRVPPSAYSDALALKADAVVFDGFFPKKAPRRHHLVINPPSEGGPFTVSGRLKGPLITEQDPKHPVMRWVTLKDVNISDSAKFVRDPGVTALAASFRDAVMVARVDEGVKSAAFGFDVTRSDLPLRIAFPILIINALDWFSGDEEGLITTYKTGESWSVHLSNEEAAKATEAKVAEPGGAEIDAPVQEGRVFLWGNRVGIYSIRAGGAPPQRIAANLADAGESDITPVKELVMGGRTIDAPSGFGLALRREIWIYLLLAAVALSLVEWLTYNRRLTV
jgi:Ca-activated chloride channel homolog